MHEKEIRDIFLKRNMPVGSCSYSDVAFNKDDSVFKTVLTTAVPYWFKPEKPHNISIYAILPDYHKVVFEILESICAELKELFPDNIFPKTPSSPRPPRRNSTPAPRRLKEFPRSETPRP